MLMLTVFSPSTFAPLPCEPNFKPCGGNLTSVCSRVSPTSLESVMVQSSEPRQSWFLLLQAPQVIALGCLASTGIFFFVALLNISKLPFWVPMASWDDTLLHFRKVGSRRLVSSC